MIGRIDIFGFAFINQGHLYFLMGDEFCNAKVKLSPVFRRPGFIFWSDLVILMRMNKKKGNHASYFLAGGTGLCDRASSHPTIEAKTSSLISSFKISCRLFSYRSSVRS